MWDASEKPFESDISGRKVFLTPGSPTAQISTALTTPSFKDPGSTVSVTINKGTTQRGFLYKDSILGTTTLIATSSGLLNGQLKITIGFPPPPPPPPPPLPPPPPTALASAPKPKPVVAVVPQVTPKPFPNPNPQPSPEPEEVLVATSSAELSVLNIESLLHTPNPEVLAATDLAVEEEVSFFDELFFWLEQYIFDKIWL